MESVKANASTEPVTIKKNDDFYKQPAYPLELLRNSDIFLMGDFK